MMSPQPRGRTRVFVATSVLLVGLLGLVASGCRSEPEEERPSPTPVERTPAWAQDAVWYQIFPERFRNGDPSNDPTRQSLQRPISDVPTAWRPTRWTRDWYEQADDERTMLTYARTHERDTVLVTLNRSPAAHSARVPLPDSLRQAYEILRTVPEGASVRLQQDATALLLEVPEHTGLILRPTTGRAGE